MRERVVRFGVGQSLAGVLATPRVVRPGAPSLVFVNAGVIHRVGPNRLYVDLARALAALGFPVLRFDLSGLGDSEAVTGGASLSESAVTDIQTACDFLERSRKAATFVVCGLCAGANYSLLAAIADRRVVGTVLIDPSVTRTRRSYVVHVVRRLRHPATWGSLIALRHPVWQRTLGRLRSGAGVPAATWEGGTRAERELSQPSAPDVRACLERIIDRGVRLMLVFTGGVNHVYNYREQLFDLLPGLDFNGQLELNFMPDTDHSVSDCASRATLVERIGSWLTRSFPATEGPGQCG